MFFLFCFNGGSTYIADVVNIILIRQTFPEDSADPTGEVIEATDKVLSGCRDQEIRQVSDNLSSKDKESLISIILAL